MKFPARIAASFIALTLLVALTGCQKGDEVSIQLRSKYLSSAADGVFFAVTASGDWTMEVEYPEGTEAWADVVPKKGSGSMNNAVFNFRANTSESPREAIVVLKGNGSEARAVYTQAAKPAASVSGNYGYDIAPFDWLELPAMKAGDGREVLAHSSNGGAYVNKSKSGTRNWSCYWDYNEHMSLWVAYPLNNSIKGSGTGRTEAWGFDPMLPSKIQPNISGGSYGGGWTRGHQLPSADRQRNQTENATTYYATNMTPQGYDFNTGIWVDLENNVRKYASTADTLYVVTGALWKESTQWSGSSSGFPVRIPTHYFKALLYRGPSSYASSSEGFMMAGFLLPHSGYSGKYTNYRMSIDELEEQTGIDFFPALERMNPTLSKQLEAASPNAQFWN